ncbi:MAG TPA: PAS domain-containing protein [Gemmatirosa sp.]|nr:PAS domain-containing protein [Gemmatirosa sp.]
MPSLPHGYPSGPPAGDGALAPADLAAVFAALPTAAAVFAADAPHHTVLAASDALLAAAGQPREAIVGRPLAEAFPTTSPEDPAADGLASLRGSVAAAVRTGAVQHMPQQRYDLRGSDGTWEARYWDAVNVPVAGPDGAVRYVLHQTEDVTARLRAEQERDHLLAELAAERERLRSLILQMPAPVALLEGPEHRITVANDAFIRGSGPRPPMLGRTSREAFPDLVGTGIHELFDQVYETGEPWVGREQFVRYDREGEGPEDSWWDLRFEPVRDADGRVAAVINFSTDVTEQVRARRAVEALLAESERARVEAEAERGRTTGILEAMSDGYFALDPEFRIVAVNAAMERNVRLTRDVLLGRVFWDVFPATVGTDYERHYRAAATEGKTAHFTDAYDDGRLALVSEADVYPAPGGGVAVFWRDVTARVRAEAERARLLAAAEEARATAEAANRAKSEFLAVMSHELRTPLNAIGGYAELIELGIHGPVTEAQRTALARIQASQRHLLGLIAGVLDYSRVEAGAATYRLVDVPVAEAVAEAEVLVAPQLRAKGLGYGWSGAPPGLAVRADREKLQQVLLNLLGNAVKFTHPRDGVPGRVEVSYTVEAAAADGTAGARVALHVRDTGEGIAAEQLARVFEPFVQVDQRLTRPHAGVGLGLAISRDLARGMGGDLTAESGVGVGSTFTLTLPAA